MGKRKSKACPSDPKPQNITEEEHQYRLLFDFAYWLENLERGSVGGATQLLRRFLKGGQDEDTSCVIQ
jgi:hypothetical protein